MLTHFTVNPHDETLNYQEICQALFGESKCLAVLEHTKKKGIGPHVHVQGETDLSDRTMSEKISELISQKHYKRKHPGHENARVCYRVKREVTDTGFQYMVKDDKSNILYQQGFTDADFEEMAISSAAHVDKLKHGFEKTLNAYLKGVIRAEPAITNKELLKHIKRAYLAHLNQEGKNWPTSGQIHSRIHQMGFKCPHTSPEFKAYCLDTI